MRQMNNKVYLSAAAIMLLAAGLISVLSVNAAKEIGEVMFFAPGGKAELRNTIELSLSEVDNLQMVYTSRNLDIYPTEGDKIIIKEYLISDKQEALSSVEASTEETTGSHTVKITGGNAVTIVMFGFLSARERIEVYIPEEGLKSLELQTKSGNITAKDNFSLAVKQLDISAGSGNIKWHDTEAEEMHVQAGSGNITAERISGNVTAQAGSGNVILEQFSGNGSMTAGSGNVRVKALSVTGDISLKTGSGNIRLALPQNLSFEFQAQTGSGNINTAFDDKLSYNKKGNYAEGIIGEKPSCLISTKANSGNVSITAE